MPSFMHTFAPGGPAIVAAGADPRRLQTRRPEIAARSGRALVAGLAPDHPAGPRAPAANPVLVPPPPPATPFVLRTLPRRRIGPVPKLAPGTPYPRLGMPTYAGFQTADLPDFSPMENAPRTQPNNRIEIPRTLGYEQHGQQLAPTYVAHDFAPATRQFNQARSSIPWAQAHFPPQFRPLTPSQQPALLRHNQSVRRAIPAAQTNAGLYTFGYPTRMGVAARIGGGPVAVLGGGSQ